MILLDTVMNTIHSLFPDLLAAADNGAETAEGTGRAPAGGSGPESAGPPGGGFAEALLRVLGGGVAKGEDVSGSSGKGGPGMTGGDDEADRVSGEKGGASSSPAFTRGGTQEEQGARTGPSAASVAGDGEGRTREPGARSAGPGPEVSAGLSADGTRNRGETEARDTGRPEAVGVAKAARGPGGEVAHLPPMPPAASPDLDRLNPEFRDRLQRVVRRMAREYGHDVRIVEGYRTRERQHALYEQGRTRPGPVVTWTRDSLHSRGRAADVQIDGTWENPEGYARLQEVAREEGLHTLGARDPGHLELSGAEGGEATPASARFRRVSRFAAADAPGPVRPARVARAASPAEVARVARVAVPGSGPAARGSRVAEGETPPAPTPGSEAAATRTPGSNATATRPIGPEATAAPSSGSGGAAAGAPGSEVLAAGTPASETGKAPAIPAEGEGRGVSTPASESGDPNASRSGARRTVALGGEALNAGEEGRKGRSPSTRGADGGGSRQGEGEVRPATDAGTGGRSSASDGGREGQERDRPGTRRRREAAPAMDPPARRTSRRTPESSSRVSRRGESPAANAAPEKGDAFSTAPGPEVNAPAGRSPGGGVAGVDAPLRADAARRVEAIQALEDAAGTRAPGRVHLDLPDADGAGTRIRLALRGDGLTGSVDLIDPLDAHHMRRRVGELHEALARRGLDASALGVRAMAGGEAARVGETDLAAFLQDPLAGIARLAESQEGTTRGRQGRNDGLGRNAHHEAGGEKESSRRNRSKEEDR